MTRLQKALTLLQAVNETRRDYRANPSPENLKVLELQVKQFQDWLPKPKRRKRKLVRNTECLS
jgi:hypothetical protein